MNVPVIVIVLALALLSAACASQSSAPTPATSPIAVETPHSTGTPVAPTAVPVTATPAVSTPTAAPLTSTPAVQSKLQPTGFPIDARTRVGIVTGESPNRKLNWEGGPLAFDYSRDAQPSSDPVAANRSGWDCRVHDEYEASPAVDWYIPAGTPVIATMDGTARLFVVTVSNAFDVYGSDREPYIGNPDRARAPLSPFPGPGGGKGIFVRVENSSFITEYAHLDLSTFSRVPAAAFANGYSVSTDFARIFAPLRSFQTYDEVASWPVRAGDVIGLSGDTGYSEAPHLHYTVARADGPLLCPTAEAGFADGGWLFR